jgi:hypothetical protein
MSASDARPVPRKAAAFRFYFPIRKNDGTLITTWAGMDSEVDKDGAGFVDCTNEATEIGTSGVGFVDLTAAEMTADAVNLKVTVTNTGALPVVVTFFPEEAGDYRAEPTADSSGTTTLLARIPGTVQPQTGDAFARLGAPSGASIAADIDSRLATSGYTAPDNATITTIAGYLDTEVAAIKAKTDLLAFTGGNVHSHPQAILAGVVTSIQAGLATAAALATIDDFLDTEVAAIKATTDKLDTAMELDGAVYRYTTNALENAPAGGGGGVSDWSSGEREQIRHRLGIDGTASAPAATPSLSTYAGADTAGTTTLLSRLTAERATNLDFLDAAVSTRLATAGYSAPESAAAVAAAVGALVVEGSTSLLASMRGVNSVLLGKASGLGTTTAVYRDLADSKARVTATVDSDGNRTAITRDLT